MGDLISRKAAIEALGERPIVWTDDDEYTLGERNQYDMDRLAIGTLPSTQPERKKGKWINYKDEHCCSVCDWVIIEDCWDEENRYDYCPYCGADMRGEEDGKQT